MLREAGLLKKAAIQCCCSRPDPLSCVPSVLEDYVGNPVARVSKRVLHRKNLIKSRVSVKLMLVRLNAVNM